jgi:hypothetical protein
MSWSGLLAAAQVVDSYSGSQWRYDMLILMDVRLA